MSTKDSTKVTNFGYISRLIEVFETDEPKILRQKLQIDYQSAKNYLNGRKPNAEILERIAEKTGISILWLLTGNGNKFHNNFDIENFGGRYKFSPSQIESLKAIAAKYNESLEEVIARGAKNAFAKDGLIDDENEIELAKILMSESSQGRESRTLARLINDSFKNEKVKNEVMGLLKPEIQEIVREEINRKVESKKDPFEDGVDLAPRGKSKILLEKDTTLNKKVG